MVSTRTIVMFAYPGVELLDVTGPLEAFATASDLLATQQPAYRIDIAAEQPGLVRASSGLAVHAARDIGAMGGIDTLLIAGGRGVEAACQRPPLVATLQEHAAQVRRIGSVCTGALLLAHAGLLDGRRAVTHWNWCERLARRYPLVRVEHEPMYLHDGNVWSSAGVTAGIDLALAMIEQDHGPALSLRVARELVMFLHRPGSQAQFCTDLAAPSTANATIRRVQVHIAGKPQADLSVDALAHLAAMSPRHFARVFKRETGVAPAEYVERARLDHVRRRLETGTDAIDLIAGACGFQGGDVMRRAFARQLGTTPSDYRDRFAACRSNPRGPAIDS